MANFRLNAGIDIKNEAGENTAIQKACMRFRRDLSMTFLSSGMEKGVIVLRKKELGREQYEIEVTEEKIVIHGSEPRSFIYAFNLLSEKYLGILPFWFWNDRQPERKRYVEIPCGRYQPEAYRIKYRGWFINDEVLINRWDAGVSREYPWEMVFEALLRCGGNLVIPGTDKNAEIYAPIASAMGLMVTHHHAEPLGAEMFLRAYPDLEPSYLKHADLFEHLWRTAIERQKEEEIVWNIGFRGQGDTPFWENDPAFDTQEKRGALIGSIMKKQYDMVREQIPDAVFCTNLYGEILELYREGCLQIPEDVILVWGDNGYGKMVSRRQGNHNPRIPALPGREEQQWHHGTYYHVSFYDLQAANHITMLPNSMEFVERELTDAMTHGITELWLINASNIKPHVYPLSFIANLWKKDYLSAKEHRKAYVREYYCDSCTQEQFTDMEACIRTYPEVMISFGDREDEHAGEQFYNYTVRDFVCGWMKDGATEPVKELFWCAGEDTFGEQMAWFEGKCSSTFSEVEALSDRCGRVTENELWKDSLVLQMKIHRHCLHGCILFAKAFRAYSQKQYKKAFFLLGDAAEAFEEADISMRDREHGKWSGFYANDCLTDVGETVFCLKRLMGYVRNLGDGPHFYQWQREVTYSERDSKVVLITNMEKHMTDWELYLAGKKTADNKFV